MRKINTFVKWIFASWRNFILSAAYVLAIYLIASLVICFHIVNREKKEAQKVTRNLDPILKVRGQSIYIGEDEVYKFIPVSGGSLIISDSNSRKAIRVKSFLIGEIEVSNTLQEYVLRRTRVKEGAAEKIMSFPANNGTKENWLDFIERLNRMTGHTFRLPTNDEWEYAARGGKASMGFVYSGGDNIDDVALYKGNTPSLGNVACKLKRPNELGLYDMSGSQWELTSTPLFEVNEDVASLNKLFLMNKEEARKQHPETYDMIMEDIENPVLVARGGAWDSPAEECQLNCTPTKHIVRTGARLIMER